MEQRYSFSLRTQVFVYGCCCLAALRDGPDHERLPAAHIASGKDAFDRAHVVGCGSVAAFVQSQCELLDHAGADWAKEAHGEQDEIDVEGKLAAGDHLELRRRT